MHLASSLGRVDIVNLLLEQEGINDSLTDTNGKTCTDVAKGRDIIRVIEGYSTSNPVLDDLTSGFQILAHFLTHHIAHSCTVT